MMAYLKIDEYFRLIKAMSSSPESLHIFSLHIILRTMAESNVVDRQWCLSAEMCLDCIARIML
ncbi:hypothetical protein ACHAQJ_006549 [Trichoderma viride]